MKLKSPLFIFFICFFISCKNQNIFQTDDTLKNKESFEILSKEYQHILEPDDKLAIGIWGHDDISVGSPFSIYNTHVSYGKWIMIKPDSIANIPFIGAIKIGGLTTLQAEALIISKLSFSIKNPIVEIKVLNREVTLLGEIMKPGTYPLDKEISTLVELIGNAEGFTFYANTKHIQIIRNNISYQVDLSTMTEFEKQNILLKSRDIVYIPSKKGKILAQKLPLLLPTAALLSSVGVLISVLSK